MNPSLAALIFTALIIGLFWLDRDMKTRTASGLWVPIIWFIIACSRPITSWLQSADGDSVDGVMEGSPADRIVLSLLIAAGVLILARRGKRVSNLLSLNRGLILLLLYCALSLVWSDFPGVAAKRWIRAIGDPVMVMIVLTDPEPSEAFKRLLARTSYLLVPLSILFIKYYPAIGVQYGPWGGGGSYGGVTTDKNRLGAVSLCLGLGALWRLLLAYKDRADTGRKRRMLAQVLVLGMILSLFAKIDAMTSLSTFLMGSSLLVTASLFSPGRGTKIVQLLMLIMIVLSVSVLFFGASPDALKSMGRNATLTDRTEVWGVVLNMVKNPVMGTGYESFWLGPRLESIWNRYWWHPSQAHNGYIETFLNLGWMGIAFLALFLGSTCRSVFAAMKAGSSMASLRVAYCFVGLVFNCTEAAFFRMQAPVWLFFLFAATSVPYVPLIESPGAKKPELWGSAYEEVSESSESEWAGAYL